MYTCIKAFKVKLQLWETQLESKYFIHFLHLKSRPFISNEKSEQYASKIALLRQELEEKFKDLNDLEAAFTLFSLPLKTNVQNAPENLQMELIKLQCDINLIQKFEDTDVIKFYSYLPKDKYPQLRFFEIRIIAMFGSTFICEQFFSQLKINV